MFLNRGTVLRCIALLVAAILLRGLPMAYALPQASAPMPQTSTANGASCQHEGHTACDEHALHAQAVQHASHGGEKACQIACDLSGAVAPPSLPSLNRDPAPPTLVPTQVRLPLADAPPPDHPPPIL